MSLELLPTEDEIYSTVVENAKLMMIDRGFMELANNNIDDDLDFLDEYLHYVLYARTRSNGAHVVVALIIEKKECVKKANMDDYVTEFNQIFQERRLNYCVYVHTKEKLSEPQKRTVQRLFPKEHTPSIQFFSYSSFYISIPRHELQPLFFRMSESSVEKNPLTRNNGKCDLPKMKWDDPIRRHYNYPADVVIIIIREGDSVIRKVSYRLVIK